MNDTNETWIKLTPYQLKTFFHLPASLIENPENLFWGRRSIIAAERIFLDERMELIAYLHDKNNRGQIFILEREGYLHKRSDLNLLASHVQGIHAHLRLSMKELSDLIVVFEEILSRLTPEEFISYLSVLHNDNDAPRSLPSNEETYYVSSYEKKILKAPLMGVFHCGKYPRHPQISLGIGHYHFAGPVPRSGRFQNQPRPGMYVNYSILGTMIELLKQTSAE